MTTTRKARWFDPLLERLLTPLIRTAQAEALREAAEHVIEIDGRRDDAAADWLRARADQVEAAS